MSDISLDSFKELWETAEMLTEDRHSNTLARTRVLCRFSVSTSGLFFFLEEGHMKRKGYNICDCCSREFLVSNKWTCPYCEYDNKPCAEGREAPEYRRKRNSIDGQIGNASKVALRTRGTKLTKTEKDALRKTLM